MTIKPVRKSIRYALLHLLFYFFILIPGIPLDVFSQKANWQNLDLNTDSVYGISIEKVYKELLRTKIPDTIIVAVIDTGIDTLHEDLRSVLWYNHLEDGNDADNNNYPGDYRGWNFLGDRQGFSTFRVSYEHQRMSYLFKRNYSKIPAAITKGSGPQGYHEGSSVDAQRTDKLQENPIQWRKRIFGDDYTDINDRNYGNNNLMVVGNMNHGTHVAGIIGAVRNNGMGINGIACAVKIMMIRAIPNGDEYDKDIALAIRYAVDNGAKVINMSFGKYFSPGRKWVLNAIRYAAEKDVLLVHGAGNDSRDIDEIAFFPTPKFKKGKRMLPNMITVGASGYTSENLIPSFSNYGRRTVDVFAPGVNIYSTVYSTNPLLGATDLGEKYAYRTGTSMATPVVTGLAAVLRSYYPSLSAVQVKMIMERSVLKIEGLVTCPGTKEKVPMKRLCKSGGIVNAWNAVVMAQRMVSE